MKKNVIIRFSEEKDLKDMPWLYRQFILICAIVFRKKKDETNDKLSNTKTNE